MQLIIRLSLEVNSKEFRYVGLNEVFIIYLQ